MQSGAPVAYPADQTRNARANRMNAHAVAAWAAVLGLLESGRRGIS
jgi:hypothetical protein